MHGLSNMMRRHFFAILHERGIWERNQYWILERALFDLSLCNERDDGLNLSIFCIFSCVMNLVISHLDVDDFFEIENIEKNEIYDFRE